MRDADFSTSLVPRTTGVRAGDLVVVRRARWRVVDVRAYEDCQVVTLRGLSPPHLGPRAPRPDPFETLERLERPRRARFVRHGALAPRLPRAARRRRAARLAACRAARRASICCRTSSSRRWPSSAGSARGCCSPTKSASARRFRRAWSWPSCWRAARSTACWSSRPPACASSGRRSCRERFAIDAAGVDGRVLRRLAATLPVGVNPWSTLAAAIASIDYVKRPEVLPAVAACRWDLVVVDEAHGVAGDSDRHAAVQRARVARRRMSCC